MVHGYKVFNYDWTCRGKQYTCPGEFEENVILKLCESGMHFCEKAIDCFNYYEFKTENHVAEIVAYGNIVGDGDKKCTDKLRIIKEVPWDEVLRIVNIGENCTGIGNTGNRNTGDWNTGNRNTGDWNTGNRNTGDLNTGDLNTGNLNTGNRNTGNLNTGNRNTGDLNTGDWNTTNYSSGCFNTVERPIVLFNEPSNWTYRDWINSNARKLMLNIETDRNYAKWICTCDMTEEEKAAHPDYETTGGYLKKITVKGNAQEWWNGLTDKEKQCIFDLPNFDAAIFKKCTGIDVGR